MEYDSLIRKKIVKGVALGFIVGVVISGGIGVAAITLTADEISFTPDDANFEVTNNKKLLMNYTNSQMVSLK